MKVELENRIVEGPGGAGVEPAFDVQGKVPPTVQPGAYSRTVTLAPRAELERRMVKGPDGVEFEVEPLRDYYCEAGPTVMPGAYLKIVEDLFNWARSRSIWILGFGTGCGAIEMRPLMTPRFDAYRFGIQWRPTPRQANLFVISGYLSVKTLKRAIREIGRASCRERV